MYAIQENTIYNGLSLELSTPFDFQIKYNQCLFLFLILLPYFVSSLG